MVRRERESREVKEGGRDSRVKGEAIENIKRSRMRPRTGHHEKRPGVKKNRIEKEGADAWLLFPSGVVKRGAQTEGGFRGECEKKIENGRELGPRTRLRLQNRY